MRLAIMQPYFFPYIGYWQLINAADHFVILDDVNYNKRGWINRNRILCDGKEHLLVNPVWQASQNKLICESEFVNDSRYLSDMIRTIKYAYRGLSYVDPISEFLQDLLITEESSLVECLTHQITAICAKLKINTPFSLASEHRNMNHARGAEGIAELCKALGYDEYINLIGGISLYNKDYFKELGIELNFLKTDFTSINRRIKMEHLDYSIIHLLMNCSLEEIEWMLGQYELL